MRHARNADRTGEGGSPRGVAGRDGPRSGVLLPRPGRRTIRPAPGPRAAAAGLLAAGSLAALVGASAFGERAAAAPEELVVEPALLAKLQTLSDGLHKEIVLCLVGRTRGDTAIASAFTMPAPRLSTATRSSFDACPGGTLASWHNHPRTPPPAGARAARSGWEGGRTSRWLCVLSDTDIRTARRLGHPFIVVSVDATTWCWWSLPEVEQFARQAISPAPPAPERLAQGEAAGLWALPDEEGN